jgi:hypothetical protein
MTSLEDKADSGDDAEVVLASDAAGVYRLLDDQLTSHENIREAGSFPQYGEFLNTVRVRAADGNWHDAENAWLECPASLAGDLVSQSVNADDTFAVSEPTKGPGGNWRFTVQKPDEPQDLL